MKTNDILATCYILALMLFATCLYSCSDEQLTDEPSPVWPDSHVSSSVPLAEWGMTMEEVAKRMDDYKVLSQTSNSLLYNSSVNIILKY